jgi:membrane protease YdiL (CAAX protease family)
VVLLPAAILAARTTRRPWRSLISVDGRLRGRWFAVCLLIAVGENLVGIITVAAFGALGYPLGPEPRAWVGWRQFAPLAIAVLLVIPLQAAAEEFLFRGSLMQALGAWVRPAGFAILLSSVAFGLAHGLPLPGFVAITAFGLVLAWVTVRTGGLEAAIAPHQVNNVSYFLLEAAGGRGDRWVSELHTDIRWSSTLAGVAFCVLYGLVIARLHGRQFPPVGELAVEPLTAPTEVPVALDDLPA